MMVSNQHVSPRPPFRSCAAALLLLAWAWPACDEDSTKIYLAAKLGVEQPSSDSLGRLVIVEAVGGKGLRIRTEQGTHVLAPSPEVVTQSCIKAPHQRFEFLVRPNDREAIVFLELTDAEPLPRENGAELPAGGLAEACPGNVVASRSLKVSLAPENPPDEGAGGSTPTPGAGGVGGAAGSSGASGGTAGTAGSGGEPGSDGGVGGTSGSAGATSGVGGQSPGAGGMNESGGVGGIGGEGGQ